MDNFAAHLEKIPLAKMPATCRDAIRVTRALGLKWLWIDAFCIIQGSYADWHKEAAEMATVYGNAFVTIIPLQSLSSHDGFLDQLNKVEGSKIPFKSSINPSVEGHYTICAVPKYSRQRDSTLQNELYTSKWSTRGWTYQENIMSSRKLYFGEADVYFRCSSQGTLDGEFWPPSEQRQTATATNRIQDDWYERLGNFSTRNLTIITDIFPAISAIAKMHCNGVEEDYQCGLWRSDIHRGVLWQSGKKELSREEHIKKLTSQDDYIAPSWSWAAVYAMGNSVSYTQVGATSPIWEVLETKSNLEDASNPFGAVLSGYILALGIWCALSSFTIRYTVMGYELWEGTKWLGDCFVDWETNEHTELSASKVPAIYTEHLVILSVAYNIRHRTPHGILLVPSTENETWYRVGLFRGSAYADFSEVFRNPQERVFKIV